MAKTPEEIKEQRRQYREENREAIRATDNARNALHREENAARANKYYRDHRDEVLAKEKAKNAAKPKKPRAAMSPEERREHRKASKRKHYEKNRDRIQEERREYNATYRAAHREKQSAYLKQYYIDNRQVFKNAAVVRKEKVRLSPEIRAEDRKRKRAWRDQHPEYPQQYYAEHKEEIMAVQRANHYADPAKADAVRTVNIAVRNGTLPPRVKCAVCTGTRFLAYHHFSYDRDHWLHVICLCSSCHRRLHGGEIFPEVESRIAQFLADASILDLNNPHGDKTV